MDKKLLVNYCNLTDKSFTNQEILNFLKEFFTNSYSGTIIKHNSLSLEKFMNEININLMFKYEHYYRPDNLIFLNIDTEEISLKEYEGSWEKISIIFNFKLLSNIGLENIKFVIFDNGNYYLLDLSENTNRIYEIDGKTYLNFKLVSVMNNDNFYNIKDSKDFESIIPMISNFSFDDEYIVSSNNKIKK